MPRVNLVPPVPVATITDKPATPIWVNWFNAIFRLLGAAPTISQGIIAPTSTPNKIGDLYVDTFAKKLYFATATSSSADWTIAN